MQVLVVIDMQNDFIDGALGTKEAVAILEPVRQKLEEAYAKGYTVIFTRDTHDESYLQTMEGKMLPIPHCVKDTPGWEISPELSVKDSVILDKPSFGSLELADYIASLQQVESVEILGLCTDICVISNGMILKARLPETPIKVVASCCAGVTPESHINALNAMKMCQMEII